METALVRMTLGARAVRFMAEVIKGKAGNLIRFPYLGGTIYLRLDSVTVLEETCTV